MEKIKIKDLYNLEETIAKDLLEKYTYPWEALHEISDYILELGKKLDNDSDYTKNGDNVWKAKSAKVAPTAYIVGPAIIGKNAEIRHCAFIRGKVIIGENAIVGNSSELKNSILFNNAKVPHFNYVGDSILGYKAHLGAGTKTCNLKSDESAITIKNGEEKIETGLRKIGAMVGDRVEVGCNSILNPGTVVGRDTTIYPLSAVRGVIKENSIYKKAGEIVNKR